MGNKNYDVIISSYSTVVNKYSNHETSTNCFEWNLKRYTFENVASVLAAVYVLLGRAVTEYRWGGSHNTLFMRHKFLVLTVKKLLKSVYIYGTSASVILCVKSLR